MAISRSCWAAGPVIDDHLADHGVGIGHAIGNAFADEDIAAAAADALAGAGSVA
jgi:hypothetical protein